MRSSRRLIALAILLAGLLTLTACPSRTSISKINADPERYRNKEVGIAGTVAESYGAAMLGGAYELDDGTGKIWVISRRGGVPSRGSRVGVKGKVYNGFTFAGRSFGTVVDETDRRSRN
ncbi:MAG TPA: hypothetical protein VNA19_01140 [Pyrinomonadaceae bacterium]|nr:hypothetical protein [Pyrinomonadaceae bacterium]